MRIVDVAEMRLIEKKTFGDLKIAESTIIDNVGRGIAQFINEIEGELGILIVVGKGNNGADGLAACRHLLALGKDVEVAAVFPEQNGSKEFEREKNQLIKLGVSILPLSTPNLLEEYFQNKNKEIIVVDAILGTGVHFPLPNHLVTIIDIINSYAANVISVDIPSGVDGTTGIIGENAILADYTLAVELPKSGFYRGDGVKCIGKILVMSVGFPDEVLQGGDKFTLDFESIAQLTPRSEFSHKNSFGHLLIIGGSRGMTGAVKMSAKSSLRVGVGLVTSITWEEAYSELLQNIPFEVMTGTIQNQFDYSKYDAILIGPGLGNTNRSREFILKMVLNYKGPLILDADAINCLSKDDLNLINTRNELTVLTPHLGEFSRFFKVEKSAIEKDPITYLFKTDFHGVLVLKSFVTYIMVDKKIFIHYSPNQALAKAGSGDVLAGIISGLIAQKTNNLIDAVQAGIMVHAKAGELARNKIGGRAVIATDIIKAIPVVFKDEK